MVSKERRAHALRVHGSGSVHRRLSWLPALPGTPVSGELLILAVERDAAMPWMIGILLAAPSRRR